MKIVSKRSFRSLSESDDVNWSVDSSAFSIDFRVMRPSSSAFSIISQMSARIKSIRHLKIGNEKQWVQIFNTYVILRPKCNGISLVPSKIEILLTLTLSFRGILVELLSDVFRQFHRNVNHPGSSVWFECGHQLFLDVSVGSLWAIPCVHLHWNSRASRKFLQFCPHEIGARNDHSKIHTSTNQFPKELKV